MITNVANKFNEKPGSPMSATLYFNRLDALRFLAFFLVFWQHAFAKLVPQGLPGTLAEALKYTGGIGVHIFFVISGFLITYLLLKELEISGSVSVKNFYIRRILRIWPLYYLILIFGIFILPNLIHSVHYCGNKLLDLTFLNNFDMDLPCYSPHIGIAWSVAIEEQFYVVWPLVFLLLIKVPRVLFCLCLAVFAGSSIFIFYNPASSYFHTFGNLNYLMLGCMGAMAFHWYGPVFSHSRFFNRRYYYPLLLLLTSLLLFKPQGITYLLFPLFYLYLVFYLIINDRTGNVSVFSWLGKYTYGMYMIHPLVILGIRMVLIALHIEDRESRMVILFSGIGSLVVTIALSVIIYELFEKRILIYKQSFSRIRTRV